MIEIACMREWFFTAQAMIEFRRCLIQGLDVKDMKSNSLLQIPHFSEEQLKHCSRGKNAVSGLADFLSKDHEQRKGLAKMDAQQLQDIEAFCRHVSEVDLKAAVEVEDEGEIVVGDVATVTVSLIRKNLKDDESLGPVNAPLFPEPKLEEWWLFLVESSSSKIIAFEKIKDQDKEVSEKLRFQVTRPGKHNFILHALCDSYAGIDAKCELSFNAQTEEEVKREIFVHQEDEDLDLQPTLFQQFMGELNHEDESEEEEEDERQKRKVKDKVKEISDEKTSKGASDSESDDDDDKKDKPKSPKKVEEKKKEESESDSESSSSSDSEKEK